jgi:short-subunit dehydrogenase
VGTAARVGAVDVFVNNAGVSKHGLFEHLRWEDMDQIVRTNVTTPLWLTRRLVSEMVSRKTRRRFGHRFGRGTRSPNRTIVHHRPSVDLA